LGPPWSYGKKKETRSQMMGPTLNGLDPMFELLDHYKTGTHTRQAPRPPSPSPLLLFIYYLEKEREKIPTQVTDTWSAHTNKQQ